MSRELHDALFELYTAGDFDLIFSGSGEQKREFIIELETSALSPKKGEIIHFLAVNRRDPEDVFDEWAKPSKLMSPDAERILGVTNERLADCRSIELVIDDFWRFVRERY